jgi:hypothetical protein
MVVHSVELVFVDFPLGKVTGKGFHLLPDMV